MHVTTVLWVELLVIFFKLGRTSQNRLGIDRGSRSTKQALPSQQHIPISGQLLDKHLLCSSPLQDTSKAKSNDSTGVKHRYIDHIMIGCSSSRAPDCPVPTLLSQGFSVSPSVQPRQNNKNNKAVGATWHTALWKWDWSNEFPEQQPWFSTCTKDHRN